MYNKVLTIVFSFFLTLSLNAENSEEAMAPGVVKGIVNDALTGQPLEYATVSITRAEDNSLVTGTITDENGVFRLKNIDAGVYKLEVTFIGYHTKKLDEFEVEPRQRSVDIGVVELQSADESLDEVMVVADRPTMSYQIDKKVINVSQQHTSASGTAVEVLENIPSISVDIEGNVSLRGSSSFTVLIDGKPSIMDANDILNQIPASQIEKIEIITNPSAKYDPDGVAGIINVVMKKNRLQGVSGVVNANVGTQSRYGSDFLINYRKERVNVYVGADFNNRSMTGNYIRRNETYRADTNFLYSNGEFDRGGQSWGARAGIDFTINPKNTISLGYRLGDRERGGESEMVFEEWNSTNPNNVNTYTSFEESTRGGFSQNLTLDYKREFDSEDHTLLAQVIWGNSDFAENSVNYLYDVNDVITNGQRAQEKGPSNRYTFKVDYTLPIGETNKFEAGYQGNIRESEERYDFEQYNTAEEEFQVDNTFTKDVIYNTNIHAVYSMFSGEIDKLGYQFGLRTEYTDRLIELLGEENDFPLNRWDFYPTVHFSYDLPSEQQVMTSYTRRLQRLRGWYLEPFYTWRDAFNVRVGNPGLDPEYIDSYELSYQNRFKKNVVSLDVYYRVTHNKIERVQSVYDESENILLTSFANVGKDYSLGTEIMLGLGPFDWWHFDVMGNVYDYRQEGQLNGRDYSTSSFNWSARLNNTFKLAKFTRLQLTGMYNSPSVTAQGEREGFMVTNLALKQDFFKNALSLTLHVRDVLGTMGHQRTIQDEGFYSYGEWDPNTPIVSFTATFRLNNFRSDRRRGSGGDQGMDEMGGDDF